MPAPIRGYKRGTFIDVTQTYHELLSFFKSHQYMPTLDELGRATYLSRSAVWRHLDYLDQWGYIIKAPGTARTITLCNPQHLEMPPHMCRPGGTGS